MPDRKKVLMGLEAHASIVHPCMSEDGKECPYFSVINGEETVLCSEKLAADALELLSESVYAHPEKLPAPTPNPPPLVIPCGAEENEE